MIGLRGVLIDSYTLKPDRPSDELAAQLVVAINDGKRWKVVGDPQDISMSSYDILRSGTQNSVNADGRITQYSKYFCLTLSPAE
jgi:hypothetical protein